MEKPKRKLKIKFPPQPITKSSNFREDASQKTSDSSELKFQKSRISEPLGVGDEELEEIVLEQPKNIIPRENVSSSLELGETLEIQVANTPEAKKENETSDQKPLYESIRYSANNSNYQESSYQSVNFTPPSTSLSLNSQEDFFRNPIAGFHQANPFNPSGYPSAPEKNYESIGENDNKRKRRM